MWIVTFFRLQGSNELSRVAVQEMTSSHPLLVLILDAGIFSSRNAVARLGFTSISALTLLYESRFYWLHTLLKHVRHISRPAAGLEW